MSLTITGWEFDKSIYNPGDTITLTVNYSSTDTNGGTGNTQYPITVTVTDSQNSTSVNSGAIGNSPEFTISGTQAEPLPTTVTVTDGRTPSGTWTLVSNDFSGTAAPFAGVAVLTSVA